MKTATVRDLRNDFHSLEAWLAEGETIQIEKRGAPVALLTPIDSAAAPKTPRARPDVRARLKAIWGDRCFTAEEVKAMREYELEGEDG
jgi:antitoxin (DNA-binding transcriptional repressor) of toxin-antitoxin stability system